MLGGFFNVHKSRGMVDGQCGNTQVVSLAEAMTFAINSIKSNPNLLPNISLGYDIRDCYGDNTNTARTTHVRTASSSERMHLDLAQSIRPEHKFNIFPPPVQ